MQFISIILALLFQSALSVSLDSHSMWNIFTMLQFEDMKSFVKANPHMLRDQNVRVLLECKGNYACAFMQNPNRLLFKAIPHRLHKQYIRQFAMKNEEKIVREMIKNDFDPKWLDYPLKRALRLNLNGQVQWIRSLLPTSMKRIKVANVNPEINPRQLLEACHAGKLERVQALIKAGVNVNAGEDYNIRWDWRSNFTALMFAAIHGRSEIAKLLIEAGADVNAVDDLGESALRIASIEGKLETAKILIDAGADIGPILGQVSRNGHFDILKVLIQAGADVNVRDKYGWTALMTASYHGYSEMAKALIEAGADVNAKDNFGWTALIIASTWNRYGPVKVLLEAGADVNLKSNRGTTALKQSKLFSKVRRELKRAIAKEKAKAKSDLTSTSKPSAWRRFKGKTTTTKPITNIII